MHRSRLKVLAVCGLVAAAIVNAQSSAPAKAADFEKSVLPVLSSKCFGCHSDRLKTAGLSLEAFRDGNAAVSKPEVWKAVRDKLNAKLMPPPPIPGPKPEETAAVVGWIDALVGPAVVEGPNPGRVTARRLNRIEYNNTVRDLLGVTLRPADEFPLDDSGYGFDNIGDVLSLSPLLMEKYTEAARKVSKAAVFGDSYENQPVLIAKIFPKRIQDDSIASGDVFPFSMRGSLYGTYYFPVEADYSFGLRIANRRGGDDAIDDAPPGAAGAAGAAGAGRAGRGGAAGRGAGGGGAGGGGAGGGGAGGRGRGGAAGRGGPPAEVNQEQLRARVEQACQGAAPVDLVFTVDGKEVTRDVFRGTTNCDYERGLTFGRAHLTAGDHYLNGFFPAYTDINPRNNMDNLGRRRVDIEYMDVVGPYNPSKAPPPSFSKIFICGGPKIYTPQCQRQITTNLARRAYRRPPAEAEIQQLLKLVAVVAKQGDSFETGVQTALQAILMSPNFLFRFEQEPKPGQAIYKLNDYELASRLSYFLWSSMPDEELMSLAAKKSLHDPAVLNAQVKRMMQDSRGENLVSNFSAQWLNLRALDKKKPDADKFPAVDDELLDYMRTETLMFMGAIIHEDRSIVDIIDAPFTYVNGPLARYYGIPDVKGREFQRVALDGKQRGGILTQASILIGSSYANRTSPVIRGKWVLETLLGQAPPPPPPVPALQTANVGTTVSLRERLAEHRADPSCAVCHNQMDPIGLALENYDAAGGWRTKDGVIDIDNSGTLPDGKQIFGASGLKEVLRAKSDLFAHNVVEKMLTFATGRGVETSDRAVVEQITRDAAAKNYRFSSLVLAIVNSGPFQMKKGESMVAAK